MVPPGGRLWPGAEVLSMPLAKRHGAGGVSSSLLLEKGNTRSRREPPKEQEHEAGISKEVALLLTLLCPRRQTRPLPSAALQKGISGT